MFSMLDNGLAQYIDSNRANRERESIDVTKRKKLRNNRSDENHFLAHDYGERLKNSTICASNRDSVHRHVRILEWRYPLTKTSYKFLNVGINVKRPSCVEIIIGDCHGKEISLSPNLWNGFLEQRCTILSYLQLDDDSEMRAPSPIYIENLTIRSTIFPR